MAAKRYESLGLAEALSKAYDYPAACQELAAILRYAYANARLPKAIKAVVFEDTISAFRRLPEILTKSGISSANLLLKAAEDTLRRRKKALAAKEFKHAVVKHSRQSKALQDGVSMQLPQDVLLHIFRFLDMHSLVSASLVSWEWNSAASDDSLWQLQYALLFGKYDMSCKKKGKTHEVDHRDEPIPDRSGSNPSINPNYREAFKRKYLGSSWRHVTKRAICDHCKTIFWLSSLTYVGSHRCAGHEEDKRAKIRAFSSFEVARYLLGQVSSDTESDDSDSDGCSSSSLSRSKLWAYPTLS